MICLRPISASKSSIRSKKRFPILPVVEISAEIVIKGFSLSWARKVIIKTLEFEGGKVFRVSVLLTGDRRIRGLNKKYLNHDYATDVIAFGLERNLGDIVVSVERARAVAKELKIPFKEELARYLVHGTLHLLGYEDKPLRKYKKMNARQETILKRFKFDG